MNSITIRYRPTVFPLFFKFKRDIPSGWNEVSDKLIISITRYYNRMIDEDQLLVEFFTLKKLIVRRLPVFYRYKLFELFDFIIDINDSKEFKIKNIAGLQAPKSSLKGVSFGRFIYGDTYFQIYMEHEKEEDLNRFIAAFYGGKYFDEDNIDELINQVAKADLNSRQAIAVNYVMIKKWLVSKYKYIFTVKQEDDPEEKKKPAMLRKQNINSGWVEIFDAMIGDDIVNREKYLELPVNEALRFLNNRIRQNRKHGH